MQASASSHHLLWLDPFSPLGDPERDRLKACGLSVQTVATLDELVQHGAQADVLALRLDGGLGLLQETLSLLQAEGLNPPVVCRVERRDLELAVGAMRLGAQHVLAIDDFTAPSWQAASARPAAKPQPAAKPARPRTVVYVDPASRHLLALAQRVARAPVSVLIEGPTGAGKEVLARVLHEASPRAQGPFVALNCAAMPDHLIEDMLFGHEKGAFTGAVKEHRGLFEQAQGGTVFLDEIAEMPIHLQAKLLRVLQERQLTRLGGERPLDLDVRVVAATNRDLRAATASREFREDLYFRLSTFKLRVPALRERPGDILPLAARLLMRHAEGGRTLSVSPEAQACLVRHPWPGNVRELENVVMRALVMCTDEVITPEHLMFDEMAPATFTAALAQPQPQPYSPQPTAEPWPEPSRLQEPLAQPGPLDHLLAQGEDTCSEPAASLQRAVQMSEQQMIQAAIQSTYSRMEAARKLGISPRTLRYKLAKFKGNAPAMA